MTSTVDPMFLFLGGIFSLELIAAQGSTALGLRGHDKDGRVEIDIVALSCTERNGYWCPARYIGLTLDRPMRAARMRVEGLNTSTLLLLEWSLGVLETASDRELAAYMLTPP